VDLLGAALTGLLTGDVLLPAHGLLATAFIVAVLLMVPLLAVYQT